MAVRPPQQDSSEPDVVEFGIAALAERLERAEVQFPTTSDRLLERLGNQKIPYDASGNDVAIAEVLRAIPQDQFDSKAELLDLLHPVFEEYRTSSGGSFVRRLRELLPF